MRTVFKGWVKLFREMVTRPWYSDSAARDVYHLLLVMADADGIVTPRAAELAELLGKKRQHVNNGINTLLFHGAIERLSSPHRPLVVKLVKPTGNGNSDDNSVVPKTDNCDEVSCPENGQPVVPKTDNSHLIYSNKNLCKNMHSINEEDLLKLLDDEAKPTREQLCMAYGITEQQFADLLRETIAEWQATGEQQQTRRHLINTIRTKSQILKRYGTNNRKPDRQSADFKPKVTGFNIIRGNKPKEGR